MRELKVLLENNGLKNVKTYIQSGNIILQSKNYPEPNIEKLIETEFGFSPKILVLTKNEFFLSVKNNPYKKYEGKFVHFYYCKDTPKIDQIKLGKLISETENYKLANNIFYLHAPDGIGRSKLVANIESVLNISTTGRNLNTVNKLIEMLENA